MLDFLPNCYCMFYMLFCFVKTGYAHKNINILISYLTNNDRRDQHRWRNPQKGWKSINSWKVINWRQNNWIQEQDVFPLRWDDGEWQEITLETIQPRLLSVPLILSSPHQSSRWINNAVKIRRLTSRIELRGFKSDFWRKTAYQCSRFPCCTFSYL